MLGHTVAKLKGGNSTLPDQLTANSHSLIVNIIARPVSAIVNEHDCDLTGLDPVIEQTGILKVTRWANHLMNAHLNEMSARLIKRTVRPIMLSNALQPWLWKVAAILASPRMG